MVDFLQDQLANINKGLQKDMDKLKEANDTIKRLNKDIERLTEENINYETINKSHKELNGKLRKELDETKDDNKKLAKQIADMEQNYIRIDGKK
jgi:septal ring factor EnvC (AmiA/AmiB activator)